MDKFSKISHKDTMNDRNRKLSQRENTHGNDITRRSDEFQQLTDPLTRYAHIKAREMNLDALDQGISNRDDRRNLADTRKGAIDQRLQLRRSSSLDRLNTLANQLLQERERGDRTTFKDILSSDRRDAKDILRSSAYAEMSRQNLPLETLQDQTERAKLEARSSRNERLARRKAEIDEHIGGALDDISKAQKEVQEYLQTAKRLFDYLPIWCPTMSSQKLASF